MTLAHISEKPWSSYSESDYTLQQWHNACLIHMHQGAPTSKSECKLPVKTPTGVVNRNGVHAAAAALAGARGGVNASPEQKAAAKKSIVRLYGQLNEQPPPSMKQSDETVQDFLDHHGIKGQRWGVRKPRGDRSAFIARAKGPDVSKMSTQELRDAVGRLQLEKQFNDLSKAKNQSSIHGGVSFAKGILRDVGKQEARRLIVEGVAAVATGAFVAKQMMG